MEIEQLIHTYGDYLYRVAFIYTKDERAAEEVVQDVFLKFHQTRHRYDERASLKTYLTKMTVNRSYDYLRSWKHRTSSLLEQLTGTNMGADRHVVQKEERGEITNAVLKLSIKYREVLLLYYYEDLQVNEIAEFLQVPVSTVKTRLQRGREKLKQALPQQQWEVLVNDDAR
ncbi:MAG: RNA polymerase sigma factor [Lysinibacillus sp.]